MGGKPKFYITTPIYYVNDVPHIGHAYTTIAADVMARFKRLQGYDVFFLTGTDEHGQKIERKAQSMGRQPQEYVDAIAAKFAKLWNELDITYDRFIRTTDADHEKTVQYIFNRLYEQGDIYKGEYAGWYCTPDETFWLESQLVDGKCPECGRPVEWVKEESYFFRLSKYAEPLLKHIEANPDFILPESRRREMVRFIEQGLEDLCVSRTTFSWGIPVPFDPKHVVYVWFDALINYVTGVGYPGHDPEKFAKYWPADVHLIGKEITRFHTIIWPAVLMALGLPLPKTVFAHGWWTVEGQKMSKSLGNVIDPADYAKEFGVDSLRYFLLREVPFGLDGDFSRSAFVYRLNSELANDYGNLLSRATAMINKFLGGRVPEPGDAEPIDLELKELHARVMREYARFMDRLEFSSALTALFTLIGRANKYIDEVAPWDLAKNAATRSRLGTVMYNLVEVLRTATIAISPFMPEIPAKVWSQLGFDGRPEDAGWQAALTWGLTPAGLEVRRGDPVFPRIDVKAALAKQDGAEAGRGAGQAAGGSFAPAADGKKADAISKGSAAGEASAPGPSGGRAGAADGEGLISIEDFAKVQLKVARVLTAEKVQGSDKLLRLEVDLGGESRQIVAGIAKYYDPEALVGKSVVVVANLKPAKLRGIVSEGMLLAASTADGGRLAVLTVDREIESGSRIR